MKKTIRKLLYTFLYIGLAFTFFTTQETLCCESPETIRPTEDMQNYPEASEETETAFIIGPEGRLSPLKELAQEQTLIINTILKLLNLRFVTLAIPTESSLERARNSMLNELTTSLQLLPTRKLNTILASILTNNNIREEILTNVKLIIHTFNTIYNGVTKNIKAQLPTQPTLHSNLRLCLHQRLDPLYDSLISTIIHNDIFVTETLIHVNDIDCAQALRLNEAYERYKKQLKSFTNESPNLIHQPKLKGLTFETLTIQSQVMFTYFFQCLKTNQAINPNVEEILLLQSTLENIRWIYKLIKFVSERFEIASEQAQTKQFLNTLSKLHYIIEKHLQELRFMRLVKVKAPESTTKTEVIIKQNDPE